MDDFAAFNKHYAEFFAPYKVCLIAVRRVRADDGTYSSPQGHVSP
jgi:hypothetical protein